METFVKCENVIGAKIGDTVVIEVYDSSKDASILAYFLPLVAFVVIFALLNSMFGAQYTIPYAIIGAIFGIIIGFAFKKFVIKEKKEIKEEDRNKVLRIV